MCRRHRITVIMTALISTAMITSAIVFELRKLGSKRSNSGLLERAWTHASEATVISDLGTKANTVKQRYFAEMLTLRAGRSGTDCHRFGHVIRWRFMF